MNDEKQMGNDVMAPDNAGGQDTLYRIHGTNEPQSIGKAMSSGCIRMLNQDIAELYDQVMVGTPVTVRPSRGA